MKNSSVKLVSKNWITPGNTTDVYNYNGGSNKFGPGVIFSSFRKSECVVIRPYFHHFLFLFGRLNFDISFLPHFCPKGSTISYKKQRINDVLSVNMHSSLIIVNSCQINSS